VPLGIKLVIPSGLYVEMVPRSSLLTQHGLFSPSSIIDADYHGEIHAVLHNVTNEVVTLKCGTRVVQLLIHERHRATSWFSDFKIRDQNGFGGTGDV
jgi:dUTP pyrophosphatase